jgi:hypothetical protein
MVTSTSLKAYRSLPIGALPRRCPARRPASSHLPLFEAARSHQLSQVPFRRPWGDLRGLRVLGARHPAGLGDDPQGDLESG